MPTPIVRNPVKVDLHVDQDLACHCAEHESATVLEPIVVKKSLKNDGIRFELMDDDFTFVGFLSPQDRKHSCFEVTNIDEGTPSIMTVSDKFNNGSSCDNVFDYELVFRRRDETEGNLYRYDPQIRNVP